MIPAGIVALADATTRRRDPGRLAWDWGEGLMIYALGRMGDRYQAYVEAYFAAHLRRGLPRIDWSDKCAPALAAIALFQRTEDPRYRAIAEAVALYLKRARPTADGGLNHFGTYWYSRFYPRSMWVDSLMMYGVFAARWGAATGDAWLTELAAEQPLAFARVLHDPETHLWKHAWLVRLRRQVPKGHVYWLRGNGWAMASLVEVLDALPPDHAKRPALRALLAQTAAALVLHQREDGRWSTVVNDDTYLESSGTALCAYGLLAGARAGYLPAAHREAGQRALAALVAGLEARADGPSMTGISAATMPYPRLGYAMLPRRRDLPFGLAAIFLAGCAELGPGYPSRQ